MTYILTWKNPAAVTPAKTNITVPVASTNTTATSLTLTGKGSANYGKAQQENLLRLLENFADGVAPNNPTIGQLWYDTVDKSLKLCTSSAPLVWSSVGGIQVTDVGEAAPTPADLGDLWFQRTGAWSGYLYVYDGLGRFPEGSVNGGWSQIWPTPMEAAIRDEYDEMKAVVNDLLFQGTDEFSVSRTGNGAISRLFTKLTDFAALDSSLDAKLTATPDTNINYSGIVDLRAQPFSHDWDALLSAARWAAWRLDLPPTMWEDISPIPFVQDGRQIPSFLLTDYTTTATEPRSTKVERRSNRRFGMVTMNRLFAETMNVLGIAVNNKFNIRGMSGSSGTNSTFGPETTTWTHCRRQGSWTGSSAISGTTFRWSSNSDRNRFVYGGNAFEIVIVHTPSGSPSAGDNALQTLLNKHNRFRLTAGGFRAMTGAAAPYTMAVAMDTTKNLANAVATPSIAQILAYTEGSATVNIVAEQQTTDTLLISGGIVLAGGLTTTGSTSFTYNIIKDCTAFGTSSTDLFPSPTVYNSATDAASTTASLVNVAITDRPTVNFTASATTVAGGANVTFTYTGTGSPTLVEWDFNYDGAYENTGTSIVKTFTSGQRVTVRCRATNAGGQDILTRPAYIYVT